MGWKVLVQVTLLYTFILLLSAAGLMALADYQQPNRHNRQPDVVMIAR